MWCDEKVRFLLLTNANKPSHNGFSSLTVVCVLTLCATESRVKFKIQCISTIIQCFISIFPLIFLWNHNKLYTVTFSLFLFSFEKEYVSHNIEYFFRKWCTYYNWARKTIIWPLVDTQFIEDYTLSVLSLQCEHLSIKTHITDSPKREYQKG